MVWLFMFNKFFNFFAPLLMERDADGVTKLSTGRVAFWILFVLAVTKWYHNVNLPTGMIESLYALLGYNVLKVPVQSVVSVKSQVYGNNLNGSLPQPPVVTDQPIIYPAPVSPVEGDVSMGDIVQNNQKVAKNQPYDS